MDEKIKHLEFIQNIITRMNTNSFQIKGISTAIAAGLLGVYAAEGKSEFIFVAVVPTFIFWLLDSYYLQMERKFRALYNDAAGITEYHTIKIFELDTTKYIGGRYNFFNVLFSKTIIWMYLPIIIFLISIGIFVRLNNCY